MAKRIEDYYQELQNQWLSHALPFSRGNFQTIASDVKENQ